MIINLAATKGWVVATHTQCLNCEKEVAERWKRGAEGDGNGEVVYPSPTD